MKLFKRLFAIVHALIAILFACAGLMLIFAAMRMGWSAFIDDMNPGASQRIIEAIGLLAASVVAIQIAQTIAEEEVIRGAHVSGPTRVRRFLSRFFVVVVVALVVEGLVATFRAVHEEPRQLLYASGPLLIGVAAVLSGWGVFIRLNLSAEEIEPEAMAEAKREDAKLQS